MFADRISNLDASGIRKVFDLAQKLENPVNLSIGQPDFDVPTEVREVAVGAINDGFNSYTPTQGIPELHDAIRGQLMAKYNYSPEKVLVTSGVSGALLLSLQCLVQPGDEVLIPDPYFVMYKHLTNLCQATPVYVDTYPDLTITAEKLEPHINERTKLLFLNTPSNPCGVVLQEQNLREIAALAKKHNLIVITDEIYDEFLYDQKPVSIAQYYDNVILLNGFSKSVAMTGWRVGYATGPAAIIEKMTMLQQYSFVCAPSFAQKAAVKAIERGSEEERNLYRAKRDRIYNGLKDTFNVVKPGGAFYIFPEVPGGTGAEAFVERAIANNLLIIPGSVFSEKESHIRISYAAADATIDRGLEILNSLV